MSSGWKDHYADVVVEIVSTRRVSIDELADRLDMLRDEVEQIIERLVARGSSSRARSAHPDHERQDFRSTRGGPRSIAYPRLISAGNSEHADCLPQSSLGSPRLPLFGRGGPLPLNSTTGRQTPQELEQRICLLIR